MVVPLSDDFRFSTLLGANEQVAIWIDGHLVHATGFGKKDVDQAIRLTAGHRHRIHIEYINPDGRAELKILWRSRVVDLQRLPVESLFPSTH